MVATPFAPYKNANLTFRIAGDYLVTDRLGNRRPVTEIVTVEALLEQKQIPRTVERPGPNSNMVWVEGFLIDPRPLPAPVTPDSYCVGIWQRLQGRFYLEFSARNPDLAALDINLVERIKGFFEPKSWGRVGTADTIVLEEGVTKIAFSYGDATPKVLFVVPAGKTVFTAQIVLQVPFNGVNPSLTLGDAAVPDRLMKVDQNSPIEVAEYETNPGHTYAADTEILLTIVPGDGATAGSGFVLIEI